MRTNASGGQQACLGRPNGQSLEVGLSRSTKGTVLSFSCYGNASGDPRAAAPAPLIPRVVGRLSQNGSLDTSAVVNASYPGSLLARSPFLGTLYDEYSGYLWVSGGAAAADASLLAFIPAGGAAAPLLISNDTLWRVLLSDTTGSALYATHSLGTPVLPGELALAGVAKYGTYPFPRVLSNGNAVGALGAGGGDAAHSPDIGGGFWQNTTTLWTADCVWGLNAYAYSAAAWSWTNYYRPPTSEGFRWVGGRTSVSGAFMLVAISCPTTPMGSTNVWSFIPATGAWRLLLSPPPNTVYKGVSAPPHDGAPFGSTSQTPALSATPSYSRAPSASTTPIPGSPTPSPRTNAFGPSSLLIVRAGWEGDATDGALSPGAAQPVWVDEVHSSLPGVRIQSVGLPWSAAAANSSLSGGGGGGSGACTLSWGRDTDWVFDEEGMPSLSADGTLVAVPCYNTPFNGPGGAASPLQLGGGKTIAVSAGTQGRRRRRR